MHSAIAGRAYHVLITDYAWDDLHLERQILEKVGASLVVAQKGDEEELVNLAARVDALLTCWKPVTETVIRNAPHCQAIGRYGIGLDNINVEFATEMGIVVTNVPTYCVEEVSEHAMALLLALARKVAFYDRSIKRGIYNLRIGTPLYRVNGQTLGIVGFGSIGRSLCRKARAFGLKIIVYSPRTEGASVKDFDVELVSFRDLLRRSDFVSIHAPLTQGTHHLFDSESLREMKPTAFLINTARGDIVDPQALLKALDEGVIAGAALDVLSKEPPDVGDPLVLHPKTVVTPHAAFNSEEALVELRVIAATPVADVLSGKLPKNVVNPRVLTQSNLRPMFAAAESSQPR
jgi:D-3-phosphoglycerate dehydrogenase